jgi:hypothetical protein
MRLTRSELNRIRGAIAPWKYFQNAYYPVVKEYGCRCPEEFVQRIFPQRYGPNPVAKRLVISWPSQNLRILESLAEGLQVRHTASHRFCLRICPPKVHPERIPFRVWFRYSERCRCRWNCRVCTNSTQGFQFLNSRAEKRALTRCILPLSILDCSSARLQLLHQRQNVCRRVIATLDSKCLAKLREHFTSIS